MFISIFLGADEILSLNDFFLPRAVSDLDLFEADVRYETDGSTSRTLFLAAAVYI